jgi:formylmethanofuran dehydrogenase subunit E
MKIIVWGCSQEKGCSSYSRWYAKNRDEINARYREWYAKNREKALEKNLKYREKNREREKQRNKQYRLENQWRKENPEKSRAYDAVKYALKLGRISRLSWCQLCGKKLVERRQRRTMGVMRRSIG